MVFEALPLWLGAHFLGDFVLGRNSWIGRQRGRLWIAMVAHAAAYATTFAVVGVTSDWLTLTVLFTTHLAIDPVKARWGLTQQLFNRFLPWKQEETEEAMALVKKPFYETQVVDGMLVKSRVERLEGHAMYLDQAAHLVVLLGLWATRGQGWL